MVDILKKSMVVVIAAAMIFSAVPFTGSMTAYADDQEPAAIQDTYEIDGVSYYNTGSAAFAKDKTRFYKELLGTRTDNIKLALPKIGIQDEKNCSVSDAWLLMGLALSQYKAEVTHQYEYELLGGAAIEGQYDLTYDDGGTGRRYDPEVKNSLKEAEEYVLKDIHGDSSLTGLLTDKTNKETVLVSAINGKQGRLNHTIAAYFYNFRVSPIIPEDKGSNYVTTTVKDSESISSSTASAIRNNTSSSVTGSQSVSTSESVSASSSINGSESYSFAESLKYGGGYEFPVGVKLSIELGITATQAISEGWSTGESCSRSNSESHNVSVTLPPYTSVLMTTKTTEAEFYSRYNCPVALVYDVILVGYNLRGYSSGESVFSKIFTFENQTGGARADILERSQLPETYSDDDDISWAGSYSFIDNLNHGDYYCPKEVLDYVTGYAPMSSTGAAFKDSIKVVSSEVEDFMPTLPLRRIKITEPNIDVISDESSYNKYTYYTAQMNVGDFSYANYMTLEGLNEKNAPYYGFSKDNGYWVITDKEGNEIASNDSPVELVKDPVSGNWRYTAVKPGTCFLVFRIDEDKYGTADEPQAYMTNDDLWKTAALEIIVTDKVTIPEGKTLTYTGKEQTGVDSGEYYTITGNTATNAGSYTATLSLKDNTKYKWSDGTTADKKVKWTISKAANPLKVSAKTATVKYSKLKKKTQTLAVTKVIKFTKKLNDKKTYTLVSAKKGSKSFKKYFKINKTTGKVTIKKNSKMKKGTYKVKVKVKALGNSNYKASSVKAVTFTIKVK